ncbi:bifunctional diguanylate cyclase/phosphodiesterase [Exiguobacterium sp. s57]|uniref:bifunctional diguanylate cyclase/phosphodiesterase n=1 Tax=Exiguobacterium sp. s57 TaxID=2751258 RepID=UPI001BE4E9E4|nr:bifunctional diguanylate cyclase/phosphodiesterase [Exiguobacterium sp. s57]
MYNLKLKGLFLIEHHLSSSYNLPLVILSIAVAIFAAGVSLDISSHLKYAKHASQHVWVVAGAFSLGLGIWAMHFIGMLAFHLQADVTYHFGIVLLSILPAVFASGLAFRIISQLETRPTQFIFVSFLISVGVVSMHYIGMESMQMNAVLTYDPVMWIASVLVAFAASLVGLYILFYIPNVSRFHWRRLASSVLIGVAVSGMHYVGMGAARFTPTEGVAQPLSGYAIDRTLLAYVIAASVITLFGIMYISIRTASRIEAQSEELEMKFESIIESASDAIIVADHNRIVIQWNRGATDLFGYTSKEVIGQSMATIIPERFREAHERGMKRYETTGEKRVIGQTVELIGLRKDGSEVPIEMSLGTWKTGKGIFFSSIIRDISERKRIEAQINDLVYLDPLTGLPNRRLFSDRLNALLGQGQSEQFALFYIDLDNFKVINDRFGHSIGDHFLKQVTTRLQSTIQTSDTLARLGGDEFIILSPHTKSNLAAHHAQELINVLHPPFELEQEEVFTGASIGISLHPSDGDTADELIKNADIAMYRAKADGKNGYQFFTNELNESVSRRSNLSMALRKGLGRGEFTVHYQPQIQLKSETVIGMEALVRWQHPKLGMISPGEFIPIAEETGSIHRLGEFVLNEACRQNKAWQDAGIPPFRVAVNISAIQFAQKDLPEVVSRALDASGLEAEYLELELTESVIQSADRAIDTMHELVALGVHLSIDDFGTGYSSLSYLKLFPIDTLKIDQHFTKNIESDEKDAALVKTIIRMAHELDLNVIAEGVETENQVAFLKAESCNQAQGYFYNRPVPAEEIEVFFQQFKKASSS